VGNLLLVMSNYANLKIDSGYECIGKGGTLGKHGVSDSDKELIVGGKIWG
jgi:hypothetical protein